MDNKKFLGEKSYPAIVDQIVKKIQQAKADTLTGTELLQKVYSQLNESKTPMMEVKEFITKAEPVAVDDASLKDVVDFCKKSATKGDLNYVINLCKEEHFQNLSRSGHPNPAQTLKEMESEFGNPSSIIEQGIKNGIFDRLNSKLLNSVKQGLGVKISGEEEETNKKLNESSKIEQGIKKGIYDRLNSKQLKSTKGLSTKEEEANKKLNESFQMEQGTCQYVPLGITYEDITTNKIVILTESDVLYYNRNYQDFTKVDDVNIAPEYRRLMEALTRTNYNPESEIFSLNENWDFICQMNGNGIMSVGSSIDNLKNIDKDKFKTLLLESINAYQNNPTLVENYNKERYLYDADNLIMLMENAQNIVKLDKLRVLRNLNENHYVMFDMHDVKGTNTPKILSIDGQKSETFDSFSSLCESATPIVGFDVKRLFESELKAENAQLSERQDKLVSLNEQQKELNVLITRVTNMKNIAEVGSPAMEKLNEQHSLLESKLEDNINQINFYQNDFKLH